MSGGLARCDRGWRVLLAVITTAQAVSSAEAGERLCPPVHLAPSEFVFFANFGHSVAIEGELVVAGAPTDGTGTAYVFRLVNGSWVKQQQLLSPDPVIPLGGDLFGWDVATNGQSVFVAALSDVPAPGLGNGSVYVFQRAGAGWIVAQHIWDPEGELKDGFGITLAVHNELAAIGASRDESRGIISGSVSIYRYDGTSWVFEQKLVPDDAEHFDFFGEAVAVHDHVVVVGAPNDDEVGSVYVYRREAAKGRWTFEQKIFAFDGPVPTPDFGEAIAIDGDTMMVGSSSASIPGIIGLGKVFVYQFNGTLWTQTQQLTIPDPFLAAVEFGEHLALEGDWAIIGDDGSWLAAGQHGAAHIYHREDGRWTLHHTLLPQVSPPWLPIFGRDVALSGNLAMVGAPGEAAQSGSAYVYVVDHLAPDLNCDGFVDSLDVMILLGSWGPLPKHGDVDDLPHAADLDRSGVVNGIDLALLLAAWG